MEPIEALDLDALEKLLAEATPPPWEWAKRRARPDTIHGKRRPDEIGSELGTGHLFNVYGANGDPNGPAVVALRNAAPALLARARATDALADALAEYVAEVDRDGIPSREWSDANLAKMRAALRKAGR